MKLTQPQVNELIQLLLGIVAHWTAGTYDQVYDHYHFCIKYNKKTKKASVVQTRSLLSRGSHTYMRNTGRIGISLCAGWKGFPVMDAQIEVMAKLIAELCFVFKIDLNGMHDARNLKHPNIIHKVPNVTDHVFYAKMDEYGKVDIGEYLPIVIKKANWYFTKLKTGEINREYTLELY